MTTDLIRSIECKKCQNDLWDMWGDTAQCSNCGHERPYYRRSARDDKTTPSQEWATKLIRSHFDGSKYGGEVTTEVTKWETELQKETGIYYVTIETGSDNIWAKDGGYFAITRRGDIRVLNTYRLTGDIKAHEQHIASMVGGKVGW